MATTVAFAVIVPVAVYVLLSVPAVQDRIRLFCEKELSRQLGAEVMIGDIDIRPFNRADVTGVTLVSEGDTVATLRRVSAGIDVWRFVSRREITVNYASVIGLSAHMSRDSLSGRLNIQPIIDKLTNKDRNKPPKKFNLRVNTVVIRDCDFSYDVLSEPETPGIFNSSHVRLTDLRADASLPLLENNNFVIALKQMDFRERSGLRLENLTGMAYISPGGIAWRGVRLQLPRTEILPSDGRVPKPDGSGLLEALAGTPLEMKILPGSHIYPPALAPIMPELSAFDETVDLSASVSVSPQSISIAYANIASRHSSVSADIENGVVANPLSRELIAYDLPIIKLSAGNRYTTLLPWGNKIADHLPSTVTLDASAAGTLFRGTAEATLTSSEGDGRVSLAYSRRALTSPIDVEAIMSMREVNAGSILSDQRFGTVSLDGKADATIGRHLRRGKAEISMTDFTYRQHVYDRVSATASIDGDMVEATVKSFDPDAAFELAAGGRIGKVEPMMRLDMRIDDFNPQALNLTDKYEGVKFSAAIMAEMNGSRPDRGEARVEVTDLAIASPDRADFVIRNLTIDSRSDSVPRLITLSSDFINGRIEGDFDFMALPSQLSAIAKRSLPVLDSTDGRYAVSLPDAGSANDFAFTFTVDETDPLRDIFKLPVTTIYPLTVKGQVDSSADVATLYVDIPFMRQGNKIIEGTRLDVSLDGGNERQTLKMTTRYPSNDGLTTYNVKSVSQGNDILTDIDWKIDRERRYDGQVILRTSLSRDEQGDIAGKIDIERSNLAFNDSVWTVHPATISYSDHILKVDNVNISRDNQFLKINGTGSASDSDSIKVDILNFDLGYLFDALGIENFQLGGRATGSLTATEVLSPMPKVYTPGIAVSDISYNRCVLGDAIVKSHFDMADKAVIIDGVITQANGGVSTINGRLYPFTSGLDFSIHADRTNVGFMNYYMGAFASDISGLGSGDLRIFGNFHDVDLEGEVYAENLRLKLDFTNTYYTATDSIHLYPGKIALRDITLRDPEGHTGILNGTVTHDYFRSPKFNFTVSDIKSMLVYDENSRQNPDWYGRIHASGNVKVKGDDDLVDIDINVSTAEKSIFTFVLSELEVADEYTFLTFRDKASLNRPVEVEADVKLSAVNRLREMLAQKGDETSANYNIELRIDITPDIEVDLVMDPVAGDKIRSNGSGNLRIVYTSADNDLRIFGTYTLDRGFYNFTLQDIIIKDFIIKEGSSISFTGDPLAARLDIHAYYSLNANLTDLDESFSRDKDLNRTNVPVHALLNVSGDIQQPEISFDLEFPTLTSDIDRKVRSIVSTEEMMNRQIIYLLTLNRFYTPDYMSTTKGNELFSVASSTISSQLSSILGQLSDKWMISPNFRSDRGDFSDMEVDLALSSRLLNNRLLLNGNFGYRDKSLNTNQFIGDFDIEYLLNKPGTIRLKAYNRYNDQNYYVRTANTTQGVGVLLKHDFDNIFGFLRRKHSKESSSDSLPDARSGYTPDSLPGDREARSGLPIDSFPTASVNP